MDKTLFGKFPKRRPPLPNEYKKIYPIFYKTNRFGRSFASRLSKYMESWMHKQVAGDLLADQHIKTTLEIGAGTLNQLQYEPEVGPYDIVEPFIDLYKDSDFIDRVRNKYASIDAVPQDQRYDRITSIASFEHICNLPEAIARSGQLLKPEGTMRVAIPSEGTMLWKLGWLLTTGLEFKIKYRLNYGVLMKFEHVNTAKEIEELLKYFFSEVAGRYIGIIKSISFYRFYTCRGPKNKECLKFIQSLNENPENSTRPTI